MQKQGTEFRVAKREAIEFVCSGDISYSHEVRVALERRLQNLPDDFKVSRSVLIGPVEVTLHGSQSTEAQQNCSYSFLRRINKLFRHQQNYF